MTQFPERRRLPASVDADDQNHARFAFIFIQPDDLRIPNRRQHIHNRRLQRLPHLLRRLHLPILHPRPHAIHNLTRHPRPEIHPQQRLLELIQRLIKILQSPQRQDIIHHP